MRAEVSQFEDQGGIQQEYIQSGGTYDILAGDKVHDLTDETFQHNVGLLRHILLRRRQMSNFE